MTDPVTPPLPSPSIVVGIDGSRAGVRAALWAVDEAVSRDLPLRLVAAAEHGDTDAAQEALHSAAAEVASTGRAVALDTEVTAAGPTLALLEASRTAVMLCVGDVGLRHFDHARVGSTAAALVASAHCPVAVIRGEQGPGSPPGWVVAELDPTPDSAAVLQYAVEEARLRRAPLRVLGTWQSEGHDAQTVAQSSQTVRLQLDRRLEQWKHRYPDLDVEPVAVHGSAVSYLAEHASAIQLAVVGARNTVAVTELLGGAEQSALRSADFSILVVDRQRLL